MFERPITTTITNPRGTETGSTWIGRGMTEFDSASEMIMLVTTADSNMYTSSPYYQDADGRLAVPRNDGRWVRTFVDGHASTIMMAAYKGWNETGNTANFYTVMPKNVKDMYMYCRSKDAIIAEQAYTNHSCAEAADAVFAVRRPW
jgi:hypothetical protein